jgi:hypothetical protein
VDQREAAREDTGCITFNCSPRLSHVNFHPHHDVTPAEVSPVMDVLSMISAIQAGRGGYDG